MRVGFFCCCFFFPPVSPDPQCSHPSRQQYPSPRVPTNNPHPAPLTHLPPTHFKPMRQVNNIIEGTLFWTSESIWHCDGSGAAVGYL